MTKVKYKFFEADEHDNTDPHQHRYEPVAFGAWGDKAEVKQISVHQYPQLKGLDDVSISIAADSSNQEYRRKTVEGLLKAARFKDSDIEFKLSGSGDFSVTVKAPKAQDSFRILCALASSAPDGRSGTFFAMLDPSIAKEIIDKEMERTKLTPTQAGLVEIKTSPVPPDRLKAYGMKDSFAYTDVDLSKAAGVFPVISMKEDAYPASTFANNVFLVKTNMALTHEGAADVKKALTAAGIQYDQSREDHKYIRVSAPVDQVAEVLGKAGILPKSVTDEIMKIAEAGHPNQRAINADVSKQPPIVKAAPAMK